MGTETRGWIGAMGIGLLALAFQAGAATPTLNAAKVTQVQNDVRLQLPGNDDLDPAPAPEAAPAPGQDSVRRAMVGDVVAGKRTLMTGKKSRAELLFNDNTIARLGANSVFSFKPGSRDIDLKSGFLLLHTPKGRGGANIKTPSASASVLGTTIMLSALPDGGMKLVVLEGTAKITVGGVTQLVSAGQLVFLTKENGLSQPITINLSKLVATSGLVNNLQGTIGSENLIQEAITGQIEQVREGELVGTGYTIGGDDNGLKVVESSELQSAIDELTDPGNSSEGEAPSGNPIPAGAVVVSPSETLDYSVPQLADANGKVLATGSFEPPLAGNFGLPQSEGTSIYFTGDRFYLTQGPPTEINDEGVGTLNLTATGESVDAQNPNAIIFNNFQGDNDNNGDGGSIDSLNFVSQGGGILVKDSAFSSNLWMNFLAAPGGGGEVTSLSEAGGDITVLNSQLGIRQDGWGAQSLMLGSFGGDISIGNSEVGAAPDLFSSGGGFNQFENFGLLVAAFDGDVSVTDSTLSVIPKGSVDGEIFSAPGIDVAAFGQKMNITNSSLFTQSAFAPTPITLFGDPATTTIQIDNSVINSALGASAGDVFVNANRIDVTNSEISAVSESGAAASVSLLANQVNLNNAIIRGSFLTLGNPADPESATINLTGSNTFYTNSGTIQDINLFGNITGTGSYVIFQNPQGGGQLNVASLSSGIPDAGVTETVKKTNVIPLDVLRQGAAHEEAVGALKSSLHRERRGKD